MRQNILVVTIAIGMSILGNLLLDVIGGLGAKPDPDRLNFYVIVAGVSTAVWLIAYHLWIKNGIRITDKIVVAIGAAGLGFSLIIPFFGLLFVILYGWVFLVVSLMTAMLLSVVARQEGEHP